MALGAGALFALILGGPYPERAARAARVLLQASVVGLGFGLPLGAVLAAGGAGLLYTAGTVALTLAAGTLLGRLMGVQRDTSFLVSAGTGICGGSAIAATAPVIGAAASGIAVALATVFLLNGVALYLFPWVGAALDLSQAQFAVWAAVAIHDTSSVVGAAASYGEEALQLATVLKLSRALWILPLVAATAWWQRRRHATGATGATSAADLRGAAPWFIGLFLVAALIRSLASPGLLPLLEGVVAVARRTLVLTLFLIGAGLTRDLLRQAGWRPLLMGTLLWALVGGVSLVLVLRGVAL